MPEIKRYDDKKMNLLVRVSQMYYEDNLSQEEVAKELRCSRPYISRLLTEAKEIGIVQVRVVPPQNYESEIEQELRVLAGLDKVIIAPDKTNISRQINVGRRAVAYLESVVKNGDIIGFSWGNTIFSMTSLLNKTRDFVDATVVQLCGGVSDLQNNIYSSEIAKNFSKAWGAKAFAPVCPALVDSRQLKEMFLSETNVSKVMELAYDANVALITMGSYGQQNALCRAGYLSEEEMFRLIEKGAVGDICAHIIDGEGNICDRELDERTVSVPLEKIKEKKRRIGVAVGQSKVECICAAIRGKIINVLITDEETALFVLERMK